MSRKFFTRLAIENENDVVEANPEELLASAAELQEVHTEVVEASGEVAEMTEAIDQGVEGAEKIMEVKAEADKAVESGEGMSEQTAKMAEIAVESICVTLGMPASHGRAIPAMENFKTPRSCLEATRVAAESMSETAAKIWAKIVEFCKMIAAKITGFIAGLIKNYTVLEKNLALVESSAKALKGDGVKGKLDKPNLAKFFTNGEKQGADAIRKLMEDLPTWASALSTISVSVKAAAEKVKDISAMSKADAEKAAGEIVKGLEEQLTARGLSGKVLPGNTKVMVKADGAKLSVEFTDAGNEAKELDVLSKADIVGFAAGAKDLAKQGDGLKKSSKELEGALDAVVKAAEAVAKSEGGEGLAVAKELANTCTRVIGAFAMKLPGLHFSTLKHISEYASASIAANKKEAAPAADAKKEEAKK